MQTAFFPRYLVPIRNEDPRWNKIPRLLFYNESYFSIKHYRDKQFLQEVYFTHSWGEEDFTFWAIEGEWVDTGDDYLTRIVCSSACNTSSPPPDLILTTCDSRHALRQRRANDCVLYLLSPFPGNLGRAIGPDCFFPCS